VRGSGLGAGDVRTVDAGGAGVDELLH
jgi:hypothetical protein